MSRLSEGLKVKEHFLLQNYIEEQGMNLSHVRDAILDLVGEQSGIFSPDDLIRLAKERDLSIGATTIYNCVNLFVKIGILMLLPMGLSGTLVRAGLCHGRTLALCRYCGSVLLYRNNLVMKELQSVTPPRYSNVAPLLLYWGVCPQCYRIGRR